MRNLTKLSIGLAIGFLSNMTSSPNHSGGYHSCLVNLGLYRTGTTTLAEAAKILFGDDVVHRDFPNLDSSTLRSLLWDPQAAVIQWWTNGNGKEQLMKLIRDKRFLGDGWIPFLVFLPNNAEELAGVVLDAKLLFGVHVTFVATQRNLKELVQSELHHWVRWDLEKRCGLTDVDRHDLQVVLTKRAQAHQAGLKGLRKRGIVVEELRLVAHLENTWPNILSKIPRQPSAHLWKQAIHQTGTQNQSPSLPVEAILFTLRLGPDNPEALQRVSSVLDQVDADELCQYMVVVALDDDEFDTHHAKVFIQALQERPRIHQLIILRNDPRNPNQPVPICRIWHDMAVKAYENGASWVVLLGDDIDLQCSFHYRAIYRAFLDIQHTVTKCDTMPYFGCPWFDDQTFPGFPTFPAVGRAHFDIFGGLMPKHREFVNQDLDPYLQQLYLKFGAAPRMTHAKLVNGDGGSDTKPARYKRVPALQWRDWVAEDRQVIHDYLTQQEIGVETKLLLDVVVPTYRIGVEYLERICRLAVPDTMRTTFIIVVDNPDKLLTATGQDDVDEAAQILEKRLELASFNHETQSTNNIRVRCNHVNSGASASRNRGLDESAADFVLFLDDDVIPNHDLLQQYNDSLDELKLQEQGSDRNILGLVGLVRFPRHPQMSWKHAAVLMSYLTFMFEIAENPIYKDPAWGVTANILIRRVRNLRFDTCYAKTGGGEDVDFCLRIAAEHGGRLRSAPAACVVHEFWPGSIWDLSKHFFNWAGGDSALFHRFPNHCYASWPNLVETAVFFVLPLWTMSWRVTPWHVCMSGLLWNFSGMLAVDSLVDFCWSFSHRRLLLHYPRSFEFCFVSHILANMYVVVLETGRLCGHVRRGHWFNLTKRFDWHCGRLPHARKNFRFVEFIKFVGFGVVQGLVAVAYGVKATNNSTTH